MCFERLLYSHHDDTNISRILKDFGEQIFSDLVFLKIFKFLAGSYTECLKLPKILKILGKILKEWTLPDKMSSTEIKLMHP